MNDDDQTLMTLIVGSAMAVAALGTALAWIGSHTAKAAGWMVQQGLLAPAGEGPIPVTEHASLDLPRIVIIVAALVFLGVIAVLLRHTRQQP